MSTFFVIDNRDGTLFAICSGVSKKTRPKEAGFFWYCFEANEKTSQAKALWFPFIFI